MNVVKGQETNSLRICIGKNIYFKSSLLLIIGLFQTSQINIFVDVIKITRIFSNFIYFTVGNI